MNAHYPGQQMNGKSQRTKQQGYGLPTILVMNLAVFLLVVSTGALLFLDQLNSHVGIITLIILGIVGVSINLAETPSIAIPGIFKKFPLGLNLITFLVVVFIGSLSLFEPIHNSWEIVVFIILGTIGVGLNLFQAFITNSSTKLEVKQNVFPQNSDTRIYQPLRRKSYVLPLPDQFERDTFFFNQPLQNPREFYGRKTESNILINRVRNQASTSITGARRIGKTWLIRYLQLIAPQRLGLKFRIGYLDATAPHCSSVSGFCETVMEVLDIPMPSTTPDLPMLVEGIEGLVSDNLVPVLCIDEFEGFRNTPEFDLNFFYALRSMSSKGLVFVVVSRDSLSNIIGEKDEASGFFNIFEQLKLKPFNQAEARDFALDKSQQASFTEREYNNLLYYGRQDKQTWSPLRLQLVGKLLLADKLQSMTGDPSCYRPADTRYWREFEERVNERYNAVIEI